MSDEDSFLRAVAAAGEDRFVGWHLTTVHESLVDSPRKKKPFPFSPGSVLPWWDTIDSSKEENE